METPRVRPNILQIKPYVPGRPIEEIQREFGLKRIIKLASNENCLPIPEHVREAVRDEIMQIHLYPDSESYYLRQRVAEYNGVDREEVIIGAGTVEIIRMILTAFLHPGEHVLTSEKTFPLYRVVSTEVGGEEAYIEAPMAEDLCFDLDRIRGMVSDETKIIILTNPNNPTGTMIPGKKISEFIDSIPDDKLIILDNAYQDYVDDLADYLTGIPMATERKNLVVLRTFSKIYGLAGLRVGYGICHQEIIGILNRLRLPFNVNRISQRAAIASLQNDDFRNQSAELNRRNRKILKEGLEALGFHVFPSQANFLLFIPEKKSDHLCLELLKEGVIVRPIGWGAVRVTVGLEEENAFFLEKLKQILAKSI